LSKADVGGLYIIYPSKKHLSITVRAFVDFVTDKAREKLPWDANENNTATHSKHLKTDAAKAIPLK
jgi:hypothetical protein